MYCINRLLPPSVFHNVLLVHCRVIGSESGSQDCIATVGVMVQGTTLTASLISTSHLGNDRSAAIIGGSAAHDYPGCENHQERMLTASSCSTLIGSMPLALVACADSTVLLLTEDHHVVLLQVVCTHHHRNVRINEKTRREEEGNAELEALHSTSRNSWRLSFRLIMDSFVPMEALINRPPTLETNNPPLCSSPDGNLAALQSYRGWVHIVHVDRALSGGHPLDAVITPIQLEKTRLVDACFLPLATAANSDPVFVPIYERPLQTVRGYFVNRKAPLGKPPTLVDAIRRWHLPGLPYKVLGLSPLTIPTRCPTFSLLDGIDTTTHLLYAFSVAGASHHLVFSSMIARKVTQRTPHAIVDMVEVAFPDGRGSEVWLLDERGKLWVTSFLELDEIVKQGDCEERGLTPLTISTPSLFGRITRMTATPAVSKTYRPATPASNMNSHDLSTSPPLIAFGDGQSIFIVDGETRQVVRSFESDGPLVGVCDGPRGSLVTLQSSGKLTSWRSAVNGSQLLAQVDLEGITSVLPYHPVLYNHHTDDVAQQHHHRRVNTFSFLVSQGTTRTRAFTLNLEGGELQEEENAAAEGAASPIAPFDSNEETLAVMSDPVSRTSDAVVGGALQAALVSRRRILWSAHTAAQQGFSLVRSITASEALSLAGIKPLCGSQHFSHASFLVKSNSDAGVVNVTATSSTPTVRDAWSPCNAVVCSVGRHVMLVAKEEDGTNTLRSVVLESFDAEVAAVCFIERHNADSVEVATAVWGAFDLHWCRYDVQQHPQEHHQDPNVLRAEDGDHRQELATVYRTVLVSVALPHMVKTLQYEPPCRTAEMRGQLWMTDASGCCYRWYDSRLSTTVDAPEMQHHTPLTVVTAADCVLVESLSFPSVIPITSIAHKSLSRHATVPEKARRVLEPGVLVMREHDAEIIAPVAASASWLVVNVLLAQRSVDGSTASAAAASSSPHTLATDEGPNRLRCGGAVTSVFDGITEDNVVILSADAHSLYINQATFSPARPPEAAAAAVVAPQKHDEQLLDASSSSSSLQPKRDYITCLHDVRSFHLPCIENIASDRATIVLSVNIFGCCPSTAGKSQALLKNGSHRSGLFVVADNDVGSMISLLDANTLVPRDAVRMKDTEFIIGAHILPNSDHDAVVVATGICKVAAPSDPTSGRIVIVGVNPLLFRASYTCEREGVYAVAVASHSIAPTTSMSRTPSSHHNHPTDSYDGVDVPPPLPSDSTHIDDDVNTATLIVAATPSKMIVLRVVGGNLLPVAKVPLADPPTALAISFPFISVSNMISGSSIFEVMVVQPPQQQHQAKSGGGDAVKQQPPQAPASPISPEGNHNITYRVVHRCMEALANGLTHIDVSYAPRRFLRSDIFRNINFVALDPPRSLPDPSGNLGGTSGIVEDGVGGAGLTSSPVVPSTVGMMRLPCRVISTHVTHSKHSAVGFFTAAVDASRSNMIPVKGLTSFNLNSQLEADFTIQSTAPRVFIGGDDGSLSVVCGIPSELSRILARVEDGMSAYLDAHSTLRPQNARVSSSTFGFAPKLLRPVTTKDKNKDDHGVVEEQLVEEEDDDEEERAVSWMGGVDTSIVSCAASTAAQSMVRQSTRLGIVDRTLVEHYLALTPAQRDASHVVSSMQWDCRDVIGSDDLESIIAALTFLD